MSIQGDRPVSGDGELLFRMARGDERAYRRLHDAHGGAVYRAALMLVRKPWDAEDVAATAFLELWRRRADVRLVDDSILPWLLTVTTFAAKNQLRSTLRYSRLLSRIPDDGPAPDHADDVVASLDGLRVSHDVRSALRALNSRDASVLLLCAVHDLPVKDAALALGVPEGTVKSRLSRVKSRLRVSLRSYAPSAEGVEG